MAEQRPSRKKAVRLLVAWLVAWPVVALLLYVTQLVPFVSSLTFLMLFTPLSIPLGCVGFFGWAWLREDQLSARGVAFVVGYPLVLLVGITYAIVAVIAPFT